MLPLFSMFHHKILFRKVWDSSVPVIALGSSGNLESALLGENPSLHNGRLHSLPLEPHTPF